MSEETLVDWAAFLNLIKQYGPTVAVLLIIIYWQWRQIDKLLERNSTIYENHIKALYEAQTRLLDKLIGPQPSSQTLPTIKELKAATGESKETGNTPGKEGKL
jgi:hypothetical protein